MAKQSERNGLFSFQKMPPEFYEPQKLRFPAQCDKLQQFSGIEVGQQAWQTDRQSSWLLGNVSSHAKETHIDFMLPYVFDKAGIQFNKLNIEIKIPT